MWWLDCIDWFCLLFPKRFAADMSILFRVTSVLSFFKFYIIGLFSPSDLSLWLGKIYFNDEIMYLWFPIPLLYFVKGFVSMLQVQHATIYRVPEMISVLVKTTFSWVLFLIDSMLQLQHTIFDVDLLYCI